LIFDFLAGPELSLGPGFNTAYKKLVFGFLHGGGEA
jgi:hypothetical protein